VKINSSPSAQQRDLIQNDFVTTRSEDLDMLLDLIAARILPIGAPVPHFGTTAPDGFISLIGLALPTSDFPLLRAVYAPVFGENLAAKTFNTPDLRGKYLFGTDSSGTGSTLGGTFGSKGMGHYHGMGAGADLNITASGGHTHDVGAGGNNFFMKYMPFGGGAFAMTGAGVQVGAVDNATSNNTHAHGSGNFAGRIGLVTGGQDGNGALHPPSIAVNWITRYR